MNENDEGSTETLLKIYRALTNKNRSVNLLDLYFRNGTVTDTWLIYACLCRICTRHRISQILPL